VPFRSIAVDRDVIPIGTLVYVPAARGVAISLPSGTQVHHDGYFFACDVGGDIIGRHIDVFLGITDHNPFAFVTSDPHRTFGLETVNNPEIQSFLAQLHS
ncbi:MAG: 3D domain-containing protein, partial [Vulcanimicrobiota bacterium]